MTGSHRTPSPWLLTVLLLVLGASTLTAQPTGGVTELTITEPSPTQFTQQNPFRTNRNLISIKFTHNGSSGSYHIHTDGADLEGSNFLAQPTDTTGVVMAGFLTEAQKTINLILLQTRINVVVQTRDPLIAVYDITAPLLTLTSLRVGGTGGTGGFTVGLTTPAYDSSNPTAERVVTPNPYRSNQDTFEISASAVDQFCPAADVRVYARIPQSTDAPPADVTGANGIFLVPISLAGQADGEYSVQVRSYDQVHDPSTFALTKGNVSGPVTLRIIRDTTAPKVTNIEIIRPANQICGTPQQTLTTGSNTFVGGETVNIRMTFDEALVSPPHVTITQNGGSPIQASPINAPTTPSTQYMFSYQPITVEAQNGPAVMTVTGQDAGTTTPSDPGYGTDQAGNAVKNFTVSPVFMLDTVPPDMRRQETGETTADAANKASSPAQGQVLNADNFPEIIRVRVKDYNTSEPPSTLSHFASGVDFTQTAPVSSGSTPSTSSAGNLNIVLTGPKGTVVGGLMGGNSPTEATLTLGTLAQIAVANEKNFPVDAVDGVIRPAEGIWTVTISLVDKLCNRRQRSFTFSVDTTPVRESSLRVTLGGQSVGKKGFCIKSTSGTPVTTFPDIVVSSTESDFSATSTRFEVLACFNGNDSSCYATVLTSPTYSGGSVTAKVAGIVNVDPLGIDFPTPAPKVPADFVTPGELDPRLGKFDGPYQIQIRPQDNAGNKGVLTTAGRREEYSEWDVCLDTLMPYTQKTFPADNSSTSSPLRFVDATVVDPPAKRTPTAITDQDYSNPTNVAAYRWVSGCGIDVNRSTMIFRIEDAYQPGRVDSSLLMDTPTGRLRGMLRFIHVPNSTDPTLPSYSPADDKYKMLLEVTDKNQNVRTLPTDGSMDGVYSINVAPVDIAGNYMIDPTKIADGATAQRTGTYFGLSATATTTLNLTGFYFLYDTAKPKLEVNNFPDNVLIGNYTYTSSPMVVASGQTNKSGHAATTSDYTSGGSISGKTFRITGFVTDLSAHQKIYGSSLTSEYGGSGMDHVEYSLTLVDSSLSPVPATSSTIIPLRRAKLEAFSESLDPVPSTTQPLGVDPSKYTNIQRPRHSFVIEDTLPTAIPTPRPSPSAPNADFYLFVIRAVDRAGNQTELSRRVILSSTSLSAPTPLTPKDGSYTNKAMLQFSWSAVSNVTTYTVQVTDPSSNVSSYNVVGTKALLGVSREGTYHWNVRALDSAGNAGTASSNWTFTVDRTAPRVSSIIISDTVDPTRNSGKLTIGDVLFTVQFTETLDSTRVPGLTFVPPGASVGAQATTTEQYAGDTFVSRGQIPTNAKPKDWDGIATIQLSGVYDKAGNTLQSQPNQTFEIDTGPDFDLRFFFNPTATQEIITVLSSTEELKLAPRITELSGLSQISNEAFQFQKNTKAYYSAFTLSYPKVSSTVGFTVSSEDLDGNTSKRAVQFTVTPLTASSSTSAMSVNRALIVNIPAGAVTSDSPLYILPASKPTTVESSTQVRAMFTAGSNSRHAAQVSVQDATTSSDQGLTVLSYLNEIGPASLTLAKAATVSAKLRGLTLPQGISTSLLGLYVWNGSRWEWTGNATDSTHVVGLTRTLGPLALAVDRNPPSITNLSVSDGEELSSSRQKITAQVNDLGSGVVRDGVTVLLDDQPLAFDFKEETGELSITPQSTITSGQHTLALSVRDRSGNVTNHAKLSVVVPDPFGVQETIAYPCPARLFTRFRIGLTRPAETGRIRIDIYDAGGRKVRRLTEDGPFSGRKHDIPWDLISDSGSKIASGVYLYKVAVTSTAGQTIKTKGKLAIIR